jgi:hypothetical protein
MRPEYIEAVDAVSTGWSYWLVFILPACVIWFSMLFRPFRSYRYQKLLVCSVFVLACILYVVGVCFHVNRIQAAKAENMQTESEQQDWWGDTGRVFAPIIAIPHSFVYCIVNLVSAGVFRLMLNHIRRARRASIIMKQGQLVLRQMQLKKNC